MKYFALLFAFLIFIPNAVDAAYFVDPEERLSDPKLEARAREISQHLRCLVCQNQSIDDSNAGLAKDLRILVRERLMAGDTNEEVKAYIVARYGDFVLLKPPFKIETLFLWGAPPLALILTLWAGIRLLRRSKENGDHTLSDAEKQASDDILKRLEG